MVCPFEVSLGHFHDDPVFVIKINDELCLCVLFDMCKEKNNKKLYIQGFPGSSF